MSSRRSQSPRRKRRGGDWSVTQGRVGSIPSDWRGLGKGRELVRSYTMFHNLRKIGGNAMSDATNARVRESPIYKIYTHQLLPDREPTAVMKFITSAYNKVGEPLLNAITKAVPELAAPIEVGKTVYGAIQGNGRCGGKTASGHRCRNGRNCPHHR